MLIGYRLDRMYQNIITKSQSMENVIKKNFISL